MDIHSLMNRFALLKGADVGRGPRHPTTPVPALAKEIKDFFQIYPFLRNDQGYVDFIECYAGAGISREPELIVDIYGFISGGTHIVKEDGIRLDERGYFAFCTTYLDDLGEVGFAFDATGERTSGIYRWIVDEHLQGDYSWYCPNFLEWLERLIKYEGRLDE